MISVCGIAGVGKSFLVECVFNHFKDSFQKAAMVSAPHPFDIKVFCQILFRSFNTKIMDEAEDILVQCLKLLKEFTCLVVIDDLRSIEDWDLIKANLLLRTSGSCIIVITRKEIVARHCATTEEALCSVKALEADASLRLFQKVCRHTYIHAYIHKYIICAYISTYVCT